MGRSSLYFVLALVVSASIGLEQKHHVKISDEKVLEAMKNILVQEKAAIHKRKTYYTLGDHQEEVKPREKKYSFDPDMIEAKDKRAVEIRSGRK